LNRVQDETLLDAFDLCYRNVEEVDVAQQVKVTQYRVVGELRVLDVKGVEDLDEGRVYTLILRNQQIISIAEAFCPDHV